MTPPAVVFDLDGVLLDSETAWTRAETRLFERHGRTYGADEKRLLIGGSLGETAEELERLLERPGASDGALAIEDSPRGATAARTAGLFVIGIPYLPGLELDADLLAGSLEDAGVRAVLGLPPSPDARPGTPRRRPPRRPRG